MSAPDPRSVESARIPTASEVLVVGAGPAGSAAAAWAARRGYEVLLVDAAAFPRDKTCGDGLTPRAVAELDRLGLGDWVRARATNRGLKLAGFGHEQVIAWPGGALPSVGSAVARTELDARIREAAVDSGASAVQARAVDIERDGPRVAAVTLQTPEGVHTVACRTLVVADGVRSPIGKLLGRTWHRDSAYGVAARAYAKTERSTEEWISSDLELRDPSGKLQPGYGWVFPLANGEVNIGVGSLATARRPADVALRPLLEQYATLRSAEWEFEGPLRAVSSALLPMGGAVSGVAGPNWALVGDAAACVNPLNGEGIDYGLEGGRMLADLLDAPDLTALWPATLRAHYGRAFSVARRLAALTTLPRVLPTAGPRALRSGRVMGVAVRVMGNLVTDEDTDLVARMWRGSGGLSMRTDRRALFA
ncbi:geranylgeranyl reductase family protein [Aldersonia sp. NBC_00410]|uniref:geranylgeranyl reductase family protein n=1 Tax=Aldersonia sp. NBC_00410 TaxID=2975954 RepID=UPI00225A1A5D|nr:geranylgeranyl reductase family protein [Aldersonia sp. NBC_00410]MCX5041676.1 geranylgeranyl reductase family protein [Aldersonia sp. NBC_00410]